MPISHSERGASERSEASGVCPGRTGGTPTTNQSHLKMNPQTILDSISNLPRIQLARKNTPFEEMPRLRAAIADSMGANLDDVPQLFIKRDDTTGFAFGGNKARHKEFLFAHLIERGIDTVINVNHYDSNNARIAAAACAKTGMKYHWVAYDMVDAPIIGNMLIAHLAGANIHRVQTIEEARDLADQLHKQETKNGRNPTMLSQTPFFDIAGMIGFLEAAAELDTQISNYQPVGAIPCGRPTTPPTNTSTPATPPVPEPLSSNTPVHIWGLCGRSLAGIRLYARNTGKPWTATAVAQPHYNTENYQEIYLDRSTRVAKLLNLDTPLEPGDITTITGYTITYGIPTEIGIEAMHLVAKTEGIILDPTYTGKSMSALIAEIKKGNVDPKTPIIFIHTGGLPQTFAFPQEIWNWQP